MTPPRTSMRRTTSRTAGTSSSPPSVSGSTRMTPARPLAPRMRATASRSVVGHDLQLDVHALPGAHHTEEAADGVGDPTVTADHAAHVRLIDRERQLDLVPALRDGD